jgi:hypothetical protein
LFSISSINLNTASDERLPFFMLCITLLSVVFVPSKINVPFDSMSFSNSDM